MAGLLSVRQYGMRNLGVYTWYRCYLTHSMGSARARLADNNISGVSLPLWEYSWYRSLFIGMMGLKTQHPVTAPETLVEIVINSILLAQHSGFWMIRLLHPRLLEYSHRRAAGFHRS